MEDYYTSINTNESKSDKRGKGFICLVVLITFFLTIILVAICALLVIVFAFIPGLAQKSLNESSLRFSSITLSSPKNHSLRIKNIIVIQNSGSFKADLQSATVSVEYDGAEMGTLDMPHISINAFVDTIVSLDTPLRISDVPRFQRSAKALLNGERVMWTLKGKVKVKPQFAISSYSLNLTTQVEIQGAKLQNIVADNMKVIRGTPGELVTTSDLSIHNPSNISIDPIGEVAFQISYKDVVIGESVISNFSLKSGNNSISGKTILNQTAASNETLSEFFSLWTTGNDIPIEIRGPIRAQSELFLNIFSNTATVIGSSTPNLVEKGVLVSIDVQNALELTIVNPLDLPMTQSELRMNNTMNDFFIKTSGCPTEQNMPPIDHPKSFTIPPHGNFTVQVGPPKLGVSSCLVGVPYAVLCLFSLQENTTQPSTPVSVATDGHLTVKIGDFTTEMHYYQQHIPIYFNGVPPTTFNLICSRPNPSIPMVKFPICAPWSLDSSCEEQEWWIKHCNTTI